VPTRVRKLFQLNADGLIVAKAASIRLLEAEPDEFADTRRNCVARLRNVFGWFLPLSANPRRRAGSFWRSKFAARGPDLRELLAPINCVDTMVLLQWPGEREILRGYGGGCHQRIGVSVLRRPFGEITFLRGLADDGRTLDSRSLRSSKPRPPKLPKHNYGRWNHRTRTGSLASDPS